MKNLKYILISFLLLLPCLHSCDSWLDVKPYDKVSEEAVYNSIEGFRSSLNGSYIELCHENLYGQDLTFGVVEFMAQRYTFDKETNFVKYSISIFDYMQAQRAFDAIWKKAYSLIANVNTLLKNCESDRLKASPVLSEMNYNIIKGEALAIRALLHFDMYRLFGPMNENKTERRLPYRKMFSTAQVDYPTGEEFMSFVMDDFRESSRLLELSDPIIEKGPSINEDPKDPFRNRTLRLNYYAVKLLLARAALYCELKEEAYEAAKVVIAVQEKWFPFVKDTDIKGTTTAPDRVFSSEVLFALEHMRRPEVFKKIFNLEHNDKLLVGARIDPQSGYYSKFNSDYRGLPMFHPMRVVGSKNIYVPNKFTESSKPELLMNRMIPIARISEAYYIAAECEEVTTEKFKILNTIRKNRGLSNVSYSFDRNLEIEYALEFLCEGQFFFFAKRKALKYINDSYGNSVDLSPTQYVVPIAISETEYN